MLPPDQGFSTDHRTGTQIGLGLIEKAQLTCHDGLFDPPYALAMRADAPVALGVELMASIPPLQLGNIHGLIGMPQQGIRVAVVARRQRVADARRNLHRNAAEDIGFADAGQQAL